MHVWIVCAHESLGQKIDNILPVRVPVQYKASRTEPRGQSSDPLPPKQKKNFEGLLRAAVVDFLAFLHEKVIVRRGMFEPNITINTKINMYCCCGIASD